MALWWLRELSSVPMIVLWFWWNIYGHSSNYEVFFPRFYIQLNAKLQGNNRGAVFYYVGFVSSMVVQLPCVVDFYIERNFRCGADVHPASVLSSGSLNVIRAFWDNHQHFFVLHLSSLPRRMMLVLVRCRPGISSDRWDATWVCRFHVYWTYST